MLHLRCFPALLLVVLALSACGRPTSTPTTPTMPATQPTTSAAQPTAVPTRAAATPAPAPSAQQPPVATIGLPTTTSVAQRTPTFAFEPMAGGPGTVVSLRGWNFAPGAPIKVRLGLPQATGEVLVSAFADAGGIWAASMTMPGNLPSGEPITQRDLRLVIMNDANQSLASGPFAFAPAAQGPLPTPFDAQPATEPADAVQRFLQAAQADRSGRLAANYAGEGLHTLLQQGSTDIGAILQEQNPFTDFTIEGVINNAPPYVYVKVILSYGTPPQPGATRTFTVKRQQDFWLVTGVAAFAADDPAQKPAQQARNAVALFVDLLSSGRYQEAGAFFGGDMQPLLDQNPDLPGDAVNDPELRGQLLERACTVNGYGCRPQRRIIDAQQLSGDAYVVFVEFNNPDGSLYQHPVDGRTAFELRVQRINEQWRVMNLLPYTS